jgi:regulatory protein
LNTSLRLLQFRPRSVAEIRTKLEKISSDQNIINQVITRLRDTKFLDDQKFAEWVIESRSRSRPRGKRLLLQELKSKGIEISTLNSQLSTLNEQDLAQSAILKKQKSWSKLPATSYKLKAIRYLQARGFPWSVIEQVVKKGYNEQDVS